MHLNLHKLRNGEEFIYSRRISTLSMHVLYIYFDELYNTLTELEFMYNSQNKCMYLKKCISKFYNTV